MMLTRTIFMFHFKFNFYFLISLSLFKLDTSLLYTSSITYIIKFLVINNLLTLIKMTICMIYHIN